MFPTIKKPYPHFILGIILITASVFIFILISAIVLTPAPVEGQGQTTCSGPNRCNLHYPNWIQQCKNCDSISGNNEWCNIVDCGSSGQTCLGGVCVGSSACINNDGDSYGANNDILCPNSGIIDCDDGNNTVYPGALELCDGLDNDCDMPTDIDENLNFTVTATPNTNAIYTAPVFVPSVALRLLPVSVFGTATEDAPESATWTITASSLDANPLPNTIYTTINSAGNFSVDADIASLLPSLSYTFDVRITATLIGCSVSSSATFTVTLTDNEWCGDGTPNGGEECDDGYTTGDPDDGCFNDCTMPGCTDADGDDYGEFGDSACLNPGIDCNDDPSDDPITIPQCPTGNPANCSLAGVSPACAVCINPGATDDICDNIDNDCDTPTNIDEDYVGAGTSCGYGICFGSIGQMECNSGIESDNCDPLLGAQSESTPAANLCNNLDDDCDQSTDEDYLITPTTCGVGACAGNPGQLECQSGVEVDTCNPLAGAAADDTTCDGVDDDCDGSVDEDCDNINPIVTNYNVTPLISITSFTIDWIITDERDLMQAELWRANDVAGSPGTWVQVQTQAAAGLSASGSFTDTPADGTWWYGVHAVDQAGNWGDETVNFARIQVVKNSLLCVDGDSDGYGVCPNCDIVNTCASDGNDCNDSDININPGAAEICDDSIDQNCDTADTLCSFNCLPNQIIGDLNGDGLITDDDVLMATDVESGIIPMPANICCIDTEPDGDYDTWDLLDIIDYWAGTPSPGACSACSDVDGDGYGNPGHASCTNGGATDCDDNNININPGATDIDCDGVDDNCSGTADEGYVSDGSCGIGVCRTNNTPSSCTGGVEILCTPALPDTEGPYGDLTCSDSVDNDCNGVMDGLDFQCANPCGNGIQNAGETCDGVNFFLTNIHGDTCDIPSSASECTFCGDGNIDANELCDDQNTALDDQCDNLCQETYCGDGTTQNPNGQGNPETCDDGGNVDGDGCDANCQTEACGNVIFLASGNGTTTPAIGGGPANEVMNLGGYVPGSPAVNSTYDAFDLNMAGPPDDYIKYGGTPYRPNYVTVSAWANTQQDPWGGPGFVVGHGADTTYSNYSIKYFWVSATDYYFYCQFNTSAGNLEVRTIINYPPGSGWYHVACTYDGIEAKIYINGIEENSTPQATAGIQNISGQLVIGANWYGGRNYMGLVDDVRIFDRVLTEPEIQDVMDNNWGCEYCGDGFTQNPNMFGFTEQCDDGNSSIFDTCNNNCQPTWCGDGIVQDSPENGDGITEECDNGRRCSGNTSADCTNNETLCASSGWGICETYVNSSCGAGCLSLMYVAVNLSQQTFNQTASYPGPMRVGLEIDPASIAWASPITLDSAGDVGTHSSLDLGSDGYARISYHTVSINGFRFVQCTNADCSTNNITTIDTGVSGRFASLVLGSDGYARISYENWDNRALKFVQCTNDDCSTNNITTIDTGDVGFHTSIALGSDGFARISYQDWGNDDLKFVQCTNADCSTKNITTIDSTDLVGLYTSLALGSDGYARISYFDGTNNNLKFVQCTNADCSTKNITIIDSTDNVGSHTSLALGSDGYARISYYDDTNDDLKFVQCTNADCSTKNITIIDSTDNVGRHTSLALGSDGYARISYYDWINEDLKFVQCTNADCSTKNITTVDSTDSVGTYTSLALDSDDLARISYYDDSNLNLKYVYQTSDYYFSGDWTSATIDFGSSVTFDTLVSSLTIPAGTNVNPYKVAANNDNLTWNFVGPDGTGGTNFGNGTSNFAVWWDTNPFQYMRIRADLTTSIPTNTPTVDEIRIYYSP